MDVRPRERRWLQAAGALLAVGLIVGGVFLTKRDLLLDDPAPPKTETGFAPLPTPLPEVELQPSRADAPSSLPPTPASPAEKIARELELPLGPRVDDGILITAVEAENDRPIADVLLVATEYRPRARFYVPKPRKEHRLAFLAETGSGEGTVAYVTDAAGQVRIPWLKGNNEIIAWHPSFHGFLWLRDDSLREARLAMVRSKLLRVRVVDGAGRPLARMPVELTQLSRKNETISGPFLTGEDGLVELQPLECLPPTRGTFDVVRVALAMPLVTPVAKILEPSRIPDEPMELVAPPTGSVTLRLPAGVFDPADPYSRATLSWSAGVVADPEDARAVEAMQSRPQRRGWLQLDSDRAELNQVGLGLTFVAIAGVFGRSGTWQTFRGPAVASEHLDVELQLGEPRPWIEGRAIDATGKPFADADLEIGVVRADANRGSYRRESSSGARTDADGRFRVQPNSEWRPPGLLRVSAYDPSNVFFAHRGERPLAALPTSVVDVGDVVLEPLPRLVAGRVVDAADRPIEAALLEVRGRETAAIEGIRATSDADGEFELLGPAYDMDLYLDVRRTFFRPASVPFTVGQEGVVVRVRPQCKLHVAATLDEGVDPRAIRVQTRDDADAPWGYALPLAPDATLMLDPGDGVQLDVRFVAQTIEREPVELLLVRKVVLSSDGITRDPRLLPADLRGTLVVTTLRLRDEAGEPIVDARVSARVPSSALESAGATVDAAFRAPLTPIESALCFTLEGRARIGWAPALERLRDGTLRILSSHEGVPFAIEAPGFVTQPLEALHGDRDVIMRRGHRVQLDLSPSWDVRAWSSAFHLRASLAPASGTDAVPTRPLQLGLLFDETLPSGGPCRLRVTLARYLPDGRLIELDVKCDPAVIELGEVAPAEPIRVKLDAETLSGLVLEANRQ